MPVVLQPVVGSIVPFGVAAEQVCLVSPVDRWAYIAALTATALVLAEGQTSPAFKTGLTGLSRLAVVEIQQIEGSLADDAWRLPVLANSLDFS